MASLSPLGASGDHWRVNKRTPKGAKQDRSTGANGAEPEEETHGNEWHQGNAGDADSSQPSQVSIAVHQIEEQHAPDKERPQEASLQFNVLRSALAELQRRLDPDQGVSNLEHMRGTLVLAQRGLAVLERCGGF